MAWGTAPGLCLEKQAAPGDHGPDLTPNERRGMRHWKLFTAPMSRGLPCQWLLEEVGAPYEVERLDIFGGETRSEAYREIHPLGAIPALTVDGVPVFESVAICLYLADAAQEALAPPLDDPQRPIYLQWMVYAVATLEPKISAPFVRSLSAPSSGRKEAATPEERRAFELVLEPLREGIERGHLLPDGFSAADIMVGVQLYWASLVGLTRTAPWTDAYLNGLMSRPAFVRAHRDYLSTGGD